MHVAINIFCSFISINIKSDLKIICSIHVVYLFNHYCANMEVLFSETKDTNKSTTSIIPMKLCIFLAIPSLLHLFARRGFF